MKSLARLLNYELKKIFRQLVLYICVILLMGMIYIYPFLTQRDYNAERQLSADLDTLYNDMNFELNEPHYRLLEQYNEDSFKVMPMDYIEIGLEHPHMAYSISQAYAKAQSLLQADENRTYTVNQALKNMNDLNNASGNIYFYRYNQLVCERVSQQKPYVFFNTNGWIHLYKLFGYAKPINIVDIALLIIGLLAFCSMFTLDYETGIITLMKTLKNGYSYVFSARFVTALCISVILVILFFIPILIDTMLAYSLNNPLEGIQNIYPDCPYLLSLFGGIVVLAGQKVLMLMILYSMVSVFGVFTKNRLAALAMGAGIDAILLIPCMDNTLYDATSYYSVVIKDKINMLINPMASILGARYLNKFDYIELFGFPFSRMVVMIGFSIFFILALQTATMVAYRKQHKPVCP